MNACLRDAVASGADLVFAVNNDTEVDPGCVGLLVEALAADPEAGVAGPAILFHAPAGQGLAGRRLLLLLEGRPVGARQGPAARATCRSGRSASRS